MKQFEYKTVVVPNGTNVADICNKEAEDGWRPILSWYRELPAYDINSREYRLLLERPISTIPVPTKRFKDIG